MSDFKIINLPEITDLRGKLCVLQEQLPFEIRRIFWITNADGQVRGGHRHVKTRQALIAIAGCVDVYMNDGMHEETIALNVNSVCLIVEPEDWHTMKFHSGAILVVLASENYNPEDYIASAY